MNLRIWSTKVHLWSTGLPILTNSDHKFFGIKMVTNGYTSEKFRKSVEKWWAKRDSNPRPTACKAAALPLRHYSQQAEKIIG